MHIAEGLSVKVVPFTFPPTVSEIALSLQVLLVFIFLLIYRPKNWCFIVLICVSLIIHECEPFLPHVQLASYEDYCASISILDLFHLFYCDRIMFFETLFIVMSLPFF